MEYKIKVAPRSDQKDRNVLADGVGLTADGKWWQFYAKRGQDRDVVLIVRADDIKSIEQLGRTP